MALRAAFCRAGLHARPAAVFVRAVLDSREEVRIGRPGSSSSFADARSIVSVLALDIQPGEAVVLHADDGQLLDRLAALLEADQ